MTITETSFGPKQYLTLRKTIAISAVSDKAMYDAAGQKLGAYMQQHGIQPVGPWSMLYFKWDQANGETDMGISFPVTGVTAVENPELSLVEIPELKASMGVLHGSYDGLAGAHQALMDYAGQAAFEKEGVPLMALEEYVVDPMTEKDPEKLVTNIYYFHR